MKITIVGGGFGGGVQYNAPSGMHDDTVMSLALAYSATQRTQVAWGD
jgi:hypothetical protein